MHVYIEYLCAYMCIYDVHTIREKKKKREIYLDYLDIYLIYIISSNIVEPCHYPMLTICNKIA